MINPDTYVIRCAPGDVLTITNRLMPQLEPAVRKQLLHVRMSLLIQHGEAGVFERVSNKSITQILAENTDFSGIEKISSGRIESISPELKHSDAEADKADDTAF